jgi:hypothetical protein
VTNRERNKQSLFIIKPMCGFALKEGEGEGEGGEISFRGTRIKVKVS